MKQVAGPFVTQIASKYKGRVMNMKKPLYLLICAAVLLTIAAGCSYHNRAAAESTGTDSAGTSKGVSGNGTGNVGQTESSDITAVDWKPTAFENVNGFDGVSMTAREGTVSAKGLTLEFSNITDSECIYGEYYILEKKIGGNWFQVPVAFEGEYGFDSIGYFLEPHGESEWTSDWEWLYGSLEPGEYRIVKDILDFRETGDHDKYFLAEEFIL